MWPQRFFHEAPHVYAGLDAQQCSSFSRPVYGPRLRTWPSNAARNHALRPYPAFIGDGKWLVRGQTSSGRYLQAIFVIEEECYYVIHARGLTDKEKRLLRRRRR